VFPLQMFLAALLG